MRHTSWSKDNGNPNSVIHLDSSHPGYVVVPDAELLFTADLHRSGSDLVLTGHDGRHTVIAGYFTTDTPPALMAPSGASLAPDLISLLTGSSTPNEYAQAQPPTPPDPIGKVEKVIGAVDVIRNGVSVTLNVGDNVYKSDVVQTGANSSVGIGFPDGTALNLVANTRMALNEYSYDANSTSNEALFSLIEGTFSFVAGKVAHAGDMKVGTPVATLGIRGTVGWVMEDQAPTITAAAGNVSWHFAAAYDSITNQQSVYTLFAIDPSCDPILGLSCNLTALTTVTAEGGVVTSLTSNGIGASPTITTAPPNAVQAQFEQFAIPQAVNTAVQAIQQSQQNNNQQNNPNQANPQSNGTNGSTTPPATLNLDGTNPNNNNNNNNNNGENSNPLPQTLNTSPPIILASLPDNSSPNNTVVIPPPEPHAPTLAIASTTLSVNASGAVALGIAETPFYAGDPVSVTISGIPTNATLSNSEDDTLTINNGSISLTPAQLPGLMLHMGTASQPATLTVTATEEGASVTENITVTVNTVAVPPVLGGATSTTVNEGGLVTLAATDTLGTVTISGLSNDLSDFNGGSYTSSTGTWTGTAAQFDALTFKAGEDGVQHLTITATVTGAPPATESYTLSVTPVAEGPVFGGSVATSAAEQGGVVTLGATVAPSDSDDTLGTVTITGLSDDLSNFNGGSYTSSTGTWTGTAAQFDALTFKAGEDGVQHLTITATTTGAEAGSTSESYTLSVTPVAEGPVFGGSVATSAAEQGGVVTLGATVAAADSDDTLGTVTITGLSNDLSNFNGGSYTSSTGTWSGTAAQFDALTFKAGEDGVQHLTITATTTGAEAGSTSESYTLSVTPVAEGPVFGGATSTTVGQDGPVTLAATVAVSDADDTLGNVTVTGLPGDLTGFSGGTYTSSTGTWSGTAAQFNALSFTAGGQGTFTLSISATTTGTEAGTSTESYTLSVSNIGPLVSGTIGTANEGGAVTLGLTDAVRDVGDTLGTVTITGLANDLSNFNGGSYTSSTGTWTGTAAQFNALTFTAGEDGSHTITISAIESGVGGGTTTANYTLTVNPIAEGPVFGGSVATSAAEQGGLVTLGATVAAADSDDTLGTVTITGLSNDLTNFNGGSYTSSSGTWTGTAAQFDALTFKAGEDGVQHLTITATTTGAEAGSTSESYTLSVTPVAEGPVFGGSVATSAAEQGGVVTLGATVAPSDSDDTLGTVTITGLSDDLSNFNGGSYTSSTGTWTGTAAQFDALTFKAGEDGVQHLTITATTTGAEAGSTSESYTLSVTPVAEGPVFGGSVATSAAEQGGVVTLGATVAPSDSDDTLGTVTITGLSNDLSNFNGGSYTSSTGTWSGTAAQFDALTFKAGEDGVQHLTITATTTGAEAGSTSESYTLSVTPVAEGPVFGGATSTTVGQDGPVTLAATVAVSDADDTLGNVTVTGLPGDLTGFSGGTYTSSTGTWSGTAAQFNALSFTAGGQGTFTLSISATTTGTEAGTSTESYTLSVSNIGPLVSGTIGTANEGGAVTLGLTDAVRDAGDTLGTVTITGLSNDLSNFNGGSYTASTGTWTGTATQFNALTFTAGEDGSHNITISATESGVGGGTTTANYTLTVNPVAEGPVFGGAVATSAAEQGGVVTLGATVAPSDSDDTLGTVTITGLSDDLSNFNGGSYTSSTGTWTGTAAQFDALTFKAGEDGVQHLTITATTTGAEAGSTSESYTLSVTPVAEGPVFGGSVATSAAEQGGVVTLGATVAPSDSDDTLGTVTITGLANDLSNFNGGSYTSSTGTWSGTAAQFDALTFKAGEDGVQHLTITATTTGAEAGSTTENYTLTVNPVAEGPVLGGSTSATVSEGGLVTLGVTEAKFDSDDTLGTVTITGLANDLSNFNGGSYTAATGTWSGTAAQFTALTFNAGETSATLSISATNTTTGEVASTVESYTLTVNPVAEGPVLGGATSATASDGGLVTLAATDTALDSDDTLGTVTITGLSNDLTNFNGGTYTASTGTWSGTAAQFNALTFNAGETSATLSISATTTGAEAGTTTENYTLTVNPDTWISTSGGDWSNVADWSTGSIPLSNGAAFIGVSGSYIVTVSSNETVGSLSTISTATLDVTGGTFTVTNFTGQGPLILSGGTFNIGSSTASVASLTESSGTLSGTGTLTVSGATSFSGNSTESGSGTAATVADGGANFASGTTLTLSDRKLELQGSSATTGTVGNNFNDVIDLNNGAVLQLDAGAIFNDTTISGGGNALLIQSTAGTAGTVTNLGIWEKTGNSSGNDTISVAFSTTNGTVSVQAGTLNLSGGGTDTGATYSGAGTIDFGGGTRTLDATSSITANALFSGSETTTVNGTYNAASTDVSGGTASLAGTVTGLGATTISGGTLNLNGASTTATSLTESSGTLSGTGTLTVSGATSFRGPARRAAAARRRRLPTGAPILPAARP